MIARLNCTFVGAFVCLALLLGATPGRAETPQDRAGELFERGNDAFAEKDWPRAYELFNEAWSLRQGYDIASNLGQVAYLMHKPVEAAERVSFALKHFPATGDPERRKQTEELMELIKKEVAVLSLQVTPPEAEVVIDGESKGVAQSLPAQMFLAPGKHTIKAVRGLESKLQILDAEAAEQYALELEVPASDTPEASTPPASPPPEAPTAPLDGGAIPSSRSLTPIYVGAPLTGAALVTAIAFGAQSSSADDDARLYLARAEEEFGDNPCGSEPGSSSGNCRRLRNAIDDRDTFGTTANVLFVTSGVLAVGTVAAYLLWPTEPASSGSLDVTPVATQQGGALLFSGTF